MVTGLKSLMNQKTLDGLVEVGQRYLGIEHPSVEISDSDFGARIMVLYKRLKSELVEVEAHLIRHQASMSIAEDLDLVMEIERIGLHSGFCLHVMQDKHLMASWTEEQLARD